MWTSCFTRHDVLPVQRLRCLCSSWSAPCLLLVLCLVALTMSEAAGEESFAAASTTPSRVARLFPSVQVPAATAGLPYFLLTPSSVLAQDTHATLPRRRSIEATDHPGADVATDETVYDNAVECVNGGEPAEDDTCVCPLYYTGPTCAQRQCPHSIGGSGPDAIAPVNPHTQLCDHCNDEFFAGMNCQLCQNDAACASQQSGYSCNHSLVTHGSSKQFQCDLDAPYFLHLLGDGRNISAQVTVNCSTSDGSAFRDEAKGACHVTIYRVEQEESYLDPFFRCDATQCSMRAGIMNENDDNGDDSSSSSTYLDDPEYAYDGEENNNSNSTYYSFLLLRFRRRLRNALRRRPRTLLAAFIRRFQLTGEVVLIAICSALTLLGLCAHMLGPRRLRRCTLALTSAMILTVLLYVSVMVAIIGAESGVPTVVYECQHTRCACAEDPPAAYTPICSQSTILAKSILPSIVNSIRIECLRDSSGSSHVGGSNNKNVDNCTLTMEDLSLVFDVHCRAAECVNTSQFPYWPPTSGDGGGAEVHPSQRLITGLFVLVMLSCVGVVAHWQYTRYRVRQLAQEFILCFHLPLDTVANGGGTECDDHNDDGAGESNMHMEQNNDHSRAIVAATHTDTTPAAVTVYQSRGNAEEDRHAEVHGADACDVPLLARAGRRKAGKLAAHRRIVQTISLLFRPSLSSHRSNNEDDADDEGDDDANEYARQRGDYVLVGDTRAPPQNNNNINNSTNTINRNNNHILDELFDTHPSSLSGRDLTDTSTPQATAVAVRHGTAELATAQALRQQIGTMMELRACNVHYRLAGTQLASESSADAARRVILRSVSFAIQSGEVMAIMGPSGAGKTTLLDLLSARAKSGEVGGCIYINGTAVTHSALVGARGADDDVNNHGRSVDDHLTHANNHDNYDDATHVSNGERYHGSIHVVSRVAATLSEVARHAGSRSCRRRRAREYANIVGYVSQEDTLLPGLTVRQTITYAARLKLPMAFAPRTICRIVREVIRTLRLESCADTLIGDGAYIRGISGGQKRRVSIAVELLANPRLLFLDEPTSGLDAVSARHVMEAVVALSKNSPMRQYAPYYFAFQPIVILSIHQPSREIYGMFDKVLLLSDGVSVYCGEAAAAAGRLAEDVRRALNSRVSDAGVDVEEYDVTVVPPCRPHDNPAEYLMRLEEMLTPAARAALWRSGSKRTSVNDTTATSTIPAATNTSNHRNRHGNSANDLGGAAGNRPDLVSSGVEAFVHCPATCTDCSSNNNDNNDTSSNLESHANSRSGSSTRAAPLLAPEAMPDPPTHASQPHHCASSATSPASLTCTRVGGDEILRMASSFRHYYMDVYSQMRLLTSRATMCLMTSYHLICCHTAVVTCLASLMCFLYPEQHLDLPGAMNRAGGVSFLLLVTSFVSLSSLEQLIIERKLFVLERENGFYSTFPYLLSKVAVDIIPLRVVPALVLTSVIYFPMGYRADTGMHFFWFVLIVVLFSVSMTLMILCIGIAAGQFGAAALLSSVFILWNFVFGGTLVQAETIPFYMRPFKSLSPFFLAFESLMVNELDGQACVFSPTDETGKPSSTSIPIMCVQYLANLGLKPGRFAADVMQLALYCFLFFIVAWVLLAWCIKIAR